MMRPVLLLAAALLAGCASPGPRVHCHPIEADFSWGALSGLGSDGQRLYTVHDHNLPGAEILILESGHSAVRLQRLYRLPLAMADLEGIAWRPGGGWWLVAEGAGHGRPRNRLLAVSRQGRIIRQVTLPPALAHGRRRGGFEGVAVQGRGARERVFVAFQRPWRDDPPGTVKIGIYRPADDRWAFYRYPLDAAEKTGISGLAALPDGRLAVLERDNRPLHRARIKRIQLVTPPPPAQTPPRLDKHLAVDLLPRIPATCGTLGKFEGLAWQNGRFWLVADDDGEGTALLYEIKP